METVQKRREREVLGSVPRSYGEIVGYLDTHWHISAKESVLQRMEQLDRECGSVSKQINTIITAGSNGKSLTMHFTARLLQAEGLSVGTFQSPHLLTYNERILLNDGSLIPNKNFTELGNLVIDAVERLKLAANSDEILTMMALLYFKEQKVDVALLEAHDGGMYAPVNMCHAKVAIITRVTPRNTRTTPEELQQAIYETAGVIKKDTRVVAGDQIKAHLQLIEQLTASCGGVWEMPIRKLAVLAYPFEQLHGRCAALAERAAFIYVNTWTTGGSTLLNNSLLVKQKGQRGRPTLEAKRQAKLNPKKTIDQFWKETVSELPARFQMLDKEKPSILLDSASNLDALENLLLGIRLLHYQRPLKGLTLVVGSAHDALHGEEFLKLIRYFFKKTPGQIFVCPPHGETQNLHGNGEDKSWDVESVTNDIKSRKMKAYSFASFSEAFEAAKTSVDEKYGLVVITGSHSIINEYWHHKGIKKLS